MSASKREPSTGAGGAPLRVSELASLCGVEQKTIHNWVARGLIPHFRTPGRHVRFLAAEVADFVARCRIEITRPDGPATRGRTSVAHVVVVVMRTARALTPRGLADELRSLRKALPISRIVWLGELPFMLPRGVERVGTARELGSLLDRATAPLGARDGHRRHPERR